jgi:ribosomal protein S18 acetylase RimI-like enzyme
LDNPLLITETTLRGGVVAQAFIDHELVGTAVLNLDTGEISPILVNSECRRQNVATLMVDVLETAGRKAGLLSIFASVAKDNKPSRSLWRSLGYAECMKYETWLGDEDATTG